MDTGRPTFPPPSGEQYEIRHGGQRATVTEVGATLRAYSIDDAAVIDGFAIDEMASGGRGQVLAPWPNRLGNGRYTFEGQAGQAPIDEPARSNAIHGLVRWLGWHPVSRSPEAVRLRCLLHPQPAYRWCLEMHVEYRLAPTGLTVTTEATNLTRARAPFGIGFHPYVTVGTSTVDRAWLLVPGRRRLVTDDDGLPVGDEEVAETAFDFTRAQSIGALQMDTAYADLLRDDDGRTATVLHDPDVGRSVTLWMDADYRYLMVYTGDTLPDDRRRRSIALEPMTCPPDALRSGRDLIALDPGATWRGSWGLSSTPPA